MIYTIDEIRQIVTPIAIGFVTVRLKITRSIIIERAGTKARIIVTRETGI